MTTTDSRLDTTELERRVKYRDQQSQAGPMRPGAWMGSNLTTQGYCLSDEERRELSLALRFSTGLCLTLVIVALAFESPVMVFALAGIGVIAGVSARHPFDRTTRTTTTAI
jgi:hypothetical protein